MKIKRFVLVFVSLALMLVVLPMQAAAAASLRETSGGISVVAVGGDSEFTTTVLKPEKLAGIQNVAGKVYPAGFIAKEAQFIGNAVNVQGHSYGQAKACFTFPTSKEGWVGNVYQWDGVKWKKLTTTLVSPVEGTPSACANFYGNGDLALIAAYTGPNEKASGNLPECMDLDTGEIPAGFHAALPYPGLVEFGDGYVVFGYRFFTFSGSGSSPIVESGIPVKAWVISAGPSDIITVVNGSGTGVSSGLGLTDILISFKLFSEEKYDIKFKVEVDGKCQHVYDLNAIY